MNQPEINVTPLIDVLLVLLIIFMVITPPKPSAFEAKLPGDPPKDNRVLPDPDTLVVGYSSDSRIMLNREALKGAIDDTAALTNRLKEVFQLRDENDNRQRTVFIRAPRSLNYGSVALLVDAVKAAGADPISLQIDDLDS
ncbi:MAG: ExbD/TolR family protein [Pyrinomonadaceae bacterium]